MSAQAQALNVAMREYVPPSAKEMMITFNQNAKLGSLLLKNPRKFPGGHSSQGNIRDTITFAPLPGGGHDKGATFNNSSRDTDQPVYWNIKLMRVPVVFNKLDAWVFNAGPDMIFDMLKRKLNLGITTMGIMCEIAAFLPGSGTTWARNINGMAEIANDGTTTAAVGGTYTTFGGLSRTDGSAWNRAVQGQVVDINGPISKRRLFQTWTDMQYPGSNLAGLTTPKVVAYIEDRFQTQQQFTNVTDPDLGFVGIKVHGSTVYQTKYCPGSYISGSSATTGDPVAYEYVLETCKAGPNVSAPISAYPTVTGETMYWADFNPEFIHAYRSTHPVMSMGFDDFQGTADDDDLVGAWRLAWAMGAKDNRRFMEMKRITA